MLKNLLLFVLRLQETLRGTFPIESVQTLVSIARQAEKVSTTRPFQRHVCCISQCCRVTHQLYALHCLRACRGQGCNSQYSLAVQAADLFPALLSPPYLLTHAPTEICPPRLLLGHRCLTTTTTLTTCWTPRMRLRGVTPTTSTGVSHQRQPAHSAAKGTSQSSTVSTPLQGTRL